MCDISFFFYFLHDFLVYTWLPQNLRESRNFWFEALLWNSRINRLHIHHTLGDDIGCVRKLFICLVSRMKKQKCLSENHIKESWG